MKITAVRVPVSESFKTQIYGHVKCDMKIVKANVTDWAKAAFEMFLDVPIEIQRVLVKEQINETRNGVATKVYREKPGSIVPFARRVKRFKPFDPPLAKLPKTKIS